MIFEELKISASIIVMVTCTIFTIPIAITAGFNVAQKIGVVECVAPQNQTEIQK